MVLSPQILIRSGIHGMRRNCGQNKSNTQRIHSNCARYHRHHQMFPICIQVRSVLRVHRYDIRQIVLMLWLVVIYSEHIYFLYLGKKKRFFPGTQPIHIIGNSKSYIRIFKCQPFATAQLKLVEMFQIVGEFDISVSFMDHKPLKTFERAYL